ncbi:MAG: NAD-dependent epimerase/dehydratase family protein [Chitinophagaceae bacterium]|nr:MAG: NAD-dependent epimerase/dehydratase family protein [Chitinophagaceae bacterium]
MSKGPIIVTGGSGFLGSNLIRKLNQYGNRNIIIIDNFDDAKFKNIKSLSFADYITYTKGLQHVHNELKKYKPSCIMHIGANADVLVRDPEVMMEANFEHSKYYLELADQYRIPMIYASSSAVYGNSRESSVEKRTEDPHNTYAWSKWMFDQYVLNNMSSFQSRVVGLRLFNIFGIGEFHKGKNASLPYRFLGFIKDNGFIDLFENEIKRDYVWVEDVADVFIDVMNDKSVGNGIYNLGGGNPVSHERVAGIVSEVFIERGLKKPGDKLIKKIPMPAELVNNFQFHTQAENLLEMIANRSAGNEAKIRKYINQLIDISYAGKI